MRILWHVALHDLRLHLSERSNIFFLFLMPIGFVFFFSLVNTGGGSTSAVQVSLPVVDRDGGFLSIAFAEQLRAENYSVDVHDAAAADTLSFPARHIEIPDSFTSRVLRGVPTEITMRSRARASATYDLAGSVRLHLAQVRFLGNLVRWAGVGDSTRIGPGAIDDVERLGPSEMGRFLAMVAEPNRVKVESRMAGTGRPVPSGMGQSIPGVLVMFVVMTVLIGGSEALTREKQQGTLRRLATSPLSARQVLLGKTLGLSLLGLSQVAILVVVTDVLSRSNVANLDFLWGPHLLGVLPVFVAFCACIAALGLLLSGLLRTPQQAESVAWLIGMALSALGGAWWPLEIMPAWMQHVGRLFPTSWAMEGLHAVITYGGGLPAVVTPVLVLLGMTALFWLAGSRLMRVAS